MCCFAAFETTFSVFMHNSYKFTAQDNSQLFLYLGLLALFIQGGIVRESFKNLKLATIIGLLLTAITFIGLAYTSIMDTLHHASSTFIWNCVGKHTYALANNPKIQIMDK